MDVSYTELSPALRGALEQMGGSELSMAVEPYWETLMLLFIVVGLILVMVAMVGWYKKFRYQNPQYANGSAMKLAVGIIMINFNPFMTIMINSIQ